MISGLTTEQTQSFTTAPGASIPGHTFTAGTNNVYRLAREVSPVRQIWQGRNAAVTTVTTTTATQSQNLTFSTDVSVGGLNPTVSLANGIYRFVMHVACTATSSADIRASYVPFIRVGAAAVTNYPVTTAGGGYVRSDTTQLYGGGIGVESLFNVTTPGAVTAGVQFRGSRVQGTLTFGANTSNLLIERVE